MLSLLDLPATVLDTVLSCLSAKELLTIGLTCKTLRDMGHSPKYWKSITMKVGYAGAIEHRKLNSLLVHLEKCCLLSSLELKADYLMFDYQSCVTRLPDRFFSVLGQCCPRLRSLRINMESNVRTTCFLLLSEHLPHLEELELTKINFTWDDKRSPPPATTTGPPPPSSGTVTEPVSSATFPSLRVLRVRESNLEARVAATVLHLFNSVTSLHTLEWDHETTAPDYTYIYTLLDHNKEIKELDITEIYYDDGHLEQVVRRCPKLQSLRLTGYFCANESVFLRVADYCPSITNLQLVGCEGVTQENVRHCFPPSCSISLTTGQYKPNTFL